MTSLSIQFKFLLDISIPEVTLPDISSSVVPFDEGKLVTVRCSVGGSPTPIRYWEKDGEKVKDCVELHESDCYLAFQYAQFPKHNGVHTCIAKNIAGEANKSVTIEIRGKTLKFIRKVYFLNLCTNLTQLQ